MRRAGVVLFALAIVGMALPARADSTFDGSVLLPGGIEPIARVLYLIEDDLNGLVGYVVDLGKRWDEYTPWRLTETSGIEPLDMFVTFYASINDGDSCNYLVDSDDGTTTRGRIECRDANDDGEITNADKARYAIVGMLTGLAGEFELKLG